MRGDIPLFFLSRTSVFRTRPSSSFPLLPRPRLLPLCITRGGVSGGTSTSTSIYFLRCVLHTENSLVTGCFSLQPFYTSKHFYCNTDQQRRHPWCHGTDKLEDILFFLLGISPTTVPDPSPALYTIYLMPHSQHSLPGRRVRAGPLSLSGDGRVRRTHHYYGNERRAHQPHATSPANDQGLQHLCVRR